MNFIMIVSDTLRRDFLGCYGNDWVSTPNIDRFAEKSIVFDKAYSASFPTVPHRRDVMTGRYTFTYTPWAPLTPKEKVLSEYLGELGYMSMMVCDCPHILENGYRFDRGFDGFEWIRGQETDRWKTQPRYPQHPCDPAKIRAADGFIKCHRRSAAYWRYEEDRFVARTMTNAVRWLEDNYREEDFFLYVDTFDPHEPWDAPQWYVDRYDPGYEGEVIDYPLYSYTDFLTPEELKHCRALYAGEVSLVDRWVGRLLERIEDMGLRKNTVVVLTTDHGFLHGEHGIIGKALRLKEGFYYCPLYEEISHIPLLISMPGVEPRRTPAIVQPPDFLPTILDLAGSAEEREGVDGCSFASVLTDGADAHREVAVSSPHVLRGGAGRTTPSVTDGKWTAVLAGRSLTDESQTDKAVDGKEKKVSSAEEQCENLLFDTKNDPAQERNVLSDHPDIHGRLRKRFVELLEQTGTRQELVDLWRAD